MPGARLNSTAIGAWQVLTASGELDFAVAPELRAALTALLDTAATPVVVDLSGVTLLDCACVSPLVEAVRRVRSPGAGVRVVGAAGRVRRVLEITGASAELGVESPVARAARTDRRAQDVAVETAEAALAARAVLPATDPRRRLLRDSAVELCLPLAGRLAAHYRQAGQPGDELTQVAALGLVKAVDRYDPARGVAFLSFTYPTVLGELRRYFRDHTWGVHVPRQLQELRLSIAAATDLMTQGLHRVPTTAELATHLEAPLEEVREAMVAAQGYRPASLSQPVGEGTSLDLADVLGGPDEDLEGVDHHESLGPLMAALPEVEQRVLAYRFFGNLTQTQIAGLLGVSQMQVSRLQSRALNRLREGLVGQR